MGPCGVGGDMPGFRYPVSTPIVFTHDAAGHATGRSPTGQIEEFAAFTRRLHSLPGNHCVTVPWEALTMGGRWGHAEAGQGGRVLGLSGTSPVERTTGGGSMKDVAKTKIRKTVITISLTVFIFAMVWLVVVGVYALR